MVVGVVVQLLCTQFRTASGCDICNIASEVWLVSEPHQGTWIVPAAFGGAIISVNDDSRLVALVTWFKSLTLQQFGWFLPADCSERFAGPVGVPGGVVELPVRGFGSGSRSRRSGSAERLELLRRQQRREMELEAVRAGPAVETRGVWWRTRNRPPRWTVAAGVAVGRRRFQHASGGLGLLDYDSGCLRLHYRDGQKCCRRVLMMAYGICAFLAASMMRALCSAGTGWWSPPGPVLPSAPTCPVDPHLPESGPRQRRIS